MASFRPSCFIRMVFLLLLLDLVHGVCYLEDSESDCTVCWITEYSSRDDKNGVTKMSQCPDDMRVYWQTLLPQEMRDGQEYEVGFVADLGNTPIIKSSSKDGISTDITHANVHSCLRSRGSCTPFVANTPGLSTHTPALVGNVDAQNLAAFHSTVMLPHDLYVIIAHVRFYVANAVDPSLPPTKYDLAVGAYREVLEGAVTVDAEAFITAGLVGGLLLMVVALFAFAVFKGLLDLDSVMDLLFSEGVALPMDILTELMDVTAFTVSIFTSIIGNKDTIRILPLAWFFCAVAWSATCYNTFMNGKQLWKVIKQHWFKQHFAQEMSLRAATHSIKRHKLSKELSMTDETAVKTCVVSYSKLMDQFKHKAAMYEMEISKREFQRRRRTIIAVLTESVPITGIECYILIKSAGSSKSLVAPVLALMAAAAFMGAQISALFDYKFARRRMEKAQEQFDDLFGDTVKELESSDNLLFQRTPSREEKETAQENRQKRFDELVRNWKNKDGVFAHIESLREASHHSDREDVSMGHALSGTQSPTSNPSSPLPQDTSESGRLFEDAFEAPTAAKEEMNAEEISRACGHLYPNAQHKAPQHVEESPRFVTVIDLASSSLATLTSTTTHVEKASLPTQTWAENPTRAIDVRIVTADQI